MKNGVSINEINEIIENLNYVNELDVHVFKADQICLFNNCEDDFKLNNIEMNIKFNPINGELVNNKAYFNPNDGIFLCESKVFDIIDSFKLYGFRNNNREFSEKIILQ